MSDSGEIRSFPIPQGWIVTTVGDVLVSIDAGKSPDCPDIPATSGEWGVLKVSAVQPNGFKSNENKIIVNKAWINPAYEVQDGDLLISRSNTFQLVGIVCHVRSPQPRLMLCDKTLRMRVDPRRAMTDFVFWQFLQPSARRHIEVHATGTSGSMKNISQPSIRSLRIQLPPLPQQRKIARILTTLDNVITQTEALIAKYQAIKQGLMHDLFTRGVDATGKLRPPQSEAPELYKQSELGWIPKEWGTSTLESLLADVPYPMRSGPFGSSLLKADLVEQGIPYLGIDNIHPEHFCPEFRRFVSPSQFQQLQRYAVREGDVVITIMGTVGRCCVIPDGIGNALSSKHIWTMSVAQDRYLPVLLCWQLNHSPWVLSTFRGKSQGGIMDSISSTTLKTLLLPHPPIGEQREIARRYESGTNEITLQELALGKFKLQKNGLMQDLLTGKVRVNVEV